MGQTKGLEEILRQVPPDYYETGIKTNFFQWVWHNWKCITIKKILEIYNPAPIKILDVGCASGFVTSKLADFFPGAQVVGIDAYKPSIKLGKKFHPNVKFKVGNAYKLPHKANIFDLVSCIETLEHLEYPLRAVREIRRVLKTNGKVLIGQDTDSLFFRIVWFFWTKTRGKVWRNSHISPLTSDMLEQLLKKNGFKILLKRFSALGLEVFFLAQKRN